MIFWPGILWIGFESNNLESFFANYENENLENFIIESEFQRKQAIYEKEIIGWTHINPTDYQTSLNTIKKMLEVIEKMSEGMTA